MPALRTRTVVSHSGSGIRLRTGEHTRVVVPSGQSFVELEAIDARTSLPLAGCGYLLSGPGRLARGGVLDRNGRARVEGVNPGSYSVRFLQLTRPSNPNMPKRSS